MPRGFFGLSRARPVRSLFMGAVNWPAVRSYIKKLERLVADEAPALIHTTGIKCHLLSGRLTRLAPVLWHLRDILAGGATRTMLQRAWGRTPVHLLANSHATAFAFDARIQNPNVVYNGIDTDHFVPGRDPWLRASAFPNI